MDGAERMPRALPLTGAGNSQKTKARDVLPQGSSGQFARLPLETGECLSAAEHNAPVAVHIQWHQGGIAYGTNVPEYLANTWFLCSECAFHTGIGFQREHCRFDPVQVHQLPPCSSSRYHSVSPREKVFRDDYFIVVKTTLPPTMVITT